VRLEINGKDNILLKLDLVNDLVCHIGEFEISARLGRIDNVFNILSNKISAITRLEIKDFADIICISLKYRFDWETIFNEAVQKDAWVNPLDVAKYFAELDAKKFELIAWITPFKADDLKKYCDTIANDIVHGKANTLAIRASHD